MIVAADNTQSAGWAPWNPTTKVVDLQHISEGEGEAHALLAAMKERYPNRHAWTVVPVLVTVAVTGAVKTASDGR